MAGRGRRWTGGWGSAARSRRTGLSVSLLSWRPTRSTCRRSLTPSSRRRCVRSVGRTIGGGCRPRGCCRTARSSSTRATSRASSMTSRVRQRPIASCRRRGWRRGDLRGTAHGGRGLRAGGARLEGARACPALRGGAAAAGAGRSTAQDRVRLADAGARALLRRREARHTLHGDAPGRHRRCVQRRAPAGGEARGGAGAGDEAHGTPLPPHADRRTYPPCASRRLQPEQGAVVGAWAHASAAHATPGRGRAGAQRLGGAAGDGATLRE
eukprot:7385470-Prymnesium_polylepis.1